VVQAPHDAATVAHPASQPTEAVRTVLAPKVSEVRRSPRIGYAVAALLALAALVVAFVGPGTVPAGGDLPPGAVTVNGVDPTGTSVAVDLSKPIPVGVTAAGADAVALSYHIFGVSVGRREAPLGAGGATTVAPPFNRHVLAGTVPAEITVLRDHTALGSERFTLSSNQSALATALAAATLIVVMICCAYLESHLRLLRRGRERPASMVAVPLFAAVLAAAVVVAAWILLGTPPTVVTLVVSAALGATAGLAAAIAAGQSGRRVREQRARNSRG
jgi:fatty acid desaturase